MFLLKMMMVMMMMMLVLVIFWMLAMTTSMMADDPALVATAVLLSGDVYFSCYDRRRPSLLLPLAYAFVRPFHLLFVITRLRCLALATRSNTHTPVVTTGRKVAKAYSQAWQTVTTRSQFFPKLTHTHTHSK